MAQTLILAKNISEANQYARAVGLQRFTYRAVRNAGAIRGIRHAEVHLLSSFLRRPDRHAIMSALRQARTLEVLYVDFVGGEILDGTENDPRFIAGPDGTDDVKADSYRQRYMLGADSTIDAKVVIEGTIDAATLTEGEISSDGLLDDYDPMPSLVARGVMSDPEDTAPDGDDTEEPSGETTTPEPSEDPAPAEEPKRRTRRRRCSTCGDLIEPDLVEAHEAEHAAPAVPAARPGDPFDNFF